MKITQTNIVNHELIGLPVKIATSQDQSLIGTKGVVVYETKQTLHILTDSRVKVAQKQICGFAFVLPSGEEVVVPGEAILSRPEDRIRKVRAGS